VTIQAYRNDVWVGQQSSKNEH